MFEHVQPGQDLEFKAFEVNAMKDAAALLKASRGFIADNGPVLPATKIRIRNNTFADKDRYSVFQLGGVDSSFGNLTEADKIESIVFSGLDASQGAYDPTKHVICVSQEPLKANALGWAIVTGLTPARIAPNVGSAKPYARVDMAGGSGRFTQETNLQETRLVQPAPNAGGIGVVYLTNSLPFTSRPIIGLRQTGPSGTLLQYTLDNITWTTFANLGSLVPDPP